MDKECIITAAGIIRLPRQSCLDNQCPGRTRDHSGFGLAALGMSHLRAGSDPGIIHAVLLHGLRLPRHAGFIDDETKRLNQQAVRNHLHAGHTAGAALSGVNDGL